MINIELLRGRIRADNSTIMIAEALNALLDVVEPLLKIRALDAEIAAMKKDATEDEAFAMDWHRFSDREKWADDSKTALAKLEASTIPPPG